MRREKKLRKRGESTISFSTPILIDQMLAFLPPPSPSRRVHKRAHNFQKKKQDTDLLPLIYTFKNIERVGNERLAQILGK